MPERSETLTRIPVSTCPEWCSQHFENDYTHVHQIGEHVTLSRFVNVKRDDATTVVVEESQTEVALHSNDSALIWTVEELRALASEALQAANLIEKEQTNQQ